MTLPSLVAVMALVTALMVPGRADAQSFYSFGTLRAPTLAPSPYGPAYAPPVYAYPPALYPAYPGYGPSYPVYAAPMVPYGYPLGYRGAWRTDYPWWSPGPRGYRWH